MLRESEPSGFTEVNNSLFSSMLYYLIVPQPQTREEIWYDVRMRLEDSIKLWDSQRHMGSIQWLTNFQEQFRAGFKCTSDNLSHASRRTCPKTNETDRRGQPLPRNVMGYMYFDK